ncbi:MAG: hypothetical protein PVI44_02430 [Balneolaceae bacterium]|jgi:hypothetical protein
MLRSNVLYTTVVGILFLFFGFILEQEDNIQINIDQATHFVVKDTLGRKTGYNPLTNTKFDEIPGGNYASLTLGGIGSENGSRYAHEFRTLVNPPLDGTYHLNVYGVKLGKYKVTILLNRDHKLTRLQKIGVTDSGDTTSFLFTKGKHPVLTKEINAAELRKDLALSYKMGWISDKTLYRSLLHKLIYAENLYAQGKIKAGIQTLQTTASNITEQLGNDDASSILTEDAKSLIRKWESNLKVRVIP